MSHPWYRAGTVAVANGSDAVVGDGTLWTSQTQAGDIFTVDRDQLYMVVAVVDNTHLTIWPTYAGTDHTAAGYAIINQFNSTTQGDLAERLANLIRQWQTREDQYSRWVGGGSTGGSGADGSGTGGYYPLTDVNGVVRYVRSPQALLDFLGDGVVRTAEEIVALLTDDVDRAESYANTAQAALDGMTTLSEATQQNVDAAATLVVTATAQANHAIAAASDAAASATGIAATLDSVTGLKTEVTALRDTTLVAQADVAAKQVQTTASQTAAVAAQTAAETAHTLARDWAVKTGGPVDGAEVSAKQHALNAAQSEMATALLHDATEAKRQTVSALAGTVAVYANTVTLAQSNATSSATEAGHSAITATDKATIATEKATIATTAAATAAAAQTAVAANATQAAAAAAMVTAAAATASAAATTATDKAAIAESAATTATTKAASADSASVNSANSAQAAAGAATDALSAKTDTVNARDLTESLKNQTQAHRIAAQAWAVNPHGVQVSDAPGYFSSLHWAEEARQYKEQAAAIVGGNNFGIIGDGSAQRITATAPGELFHLVGGLATQIVFNSGTKSATFNVVTNNLPFTPAGGLSSETLVDAVHELDTDKLDASHAGTGGSTHAAASGASAGFMSSAHYTLVAGAAASSGNGTLVRRDGSGNFSAGVISADLVGDVTGSVAGNADTATRWATTRTLTLSGVTASTEDVDGTGNVSVAISAVPASLLTGTIDISRLPAGALERVVPVVDDATRFLLTTAEVQLGDTVKVGTGPDAPLYLVVDTSNLDKDDGYLPYHSGGAASAPWSGITDKPEKIVNIGAMDTSLGLVEQTGLQTFAKRAIGYGASTDIPTKSDVAGAISTAMSGLSTSSIGVGNTTAVITDTGSNGKLTVSPEGTSKFEVSTAGAAIKNGGTLTFADGSVQSTAASGSGGTSTAPTLVASGATMSVTASAVQAVYAQYVGQTFAVDYNTEASYTQEDATNGTDASGGAFVLHNTAGAVIDTNTKLLIHADGVNGSTEIVDERGITPFGTHCAYFDGTAYWKIPASYRLAWGATQAFTLEFWVRLGTMSVQNTVFSVFTGTTNRLGLDWNPATGKLIAFGTPSFTSASTFSAETWLHVAFVRSSGTMHLYVNGVQEGSAADTFAYDACAIRFASNAVGTGTLTGWMDQFRVSKIARYTGAFTPPTTAFVTDADTVHLFSFDDGHGSQFIRDSSKSGHELLITGGSTNCISTNRAKFGTTSLNCVADGMQATPSKYHADFNPGSDDFTIDCWFYPTATANSTIFNFDGTGGWGPYVSIKSNGQMSIDASSNASTWNISAAATDRGAYTLNAWNHAALTRSGANLYFFLGGVLQATLAVGTASLFNGSTQRLWLGRSSVGGAPLTGSIDEFRLKRGQAVWTADFTPPTSAYVTDDYTVLLCHFEGADGDKVTLDSSESSYGTNAFGDTTTPILTLPHGESLTAAYTRGGHGTSLQLNGTTQYAQFFGLSTPSAGHPLYFSASDKFCAEMWFYISSFGASTSLLFQLIGISGAYGTSLSFDVSTSGQVRAWVNNTQIAASAANISTGWNHVAFVREARGYVLYTGGIGTAAAPPNINMSYANEAYSVYLGSDVGASRYLLGAIDAIRITHGKPRYTANFTPGNLTQDDDTALLWVFDGAVGQKWVKELSKNTALISSTNARTVKDGRYITPVMTANHCSITTTSGYFKFGTGGLNSDGAANNHYTLPHSADFCPQGDYTFEAQVRPGGSGNRHVLYKAGSTIATSDFFFGIDSAGKAVFQHYNGSANMHTVTGTTTVSTATMTHVAATLSGTTLRLFVGGVQEASTTVAGPMNVNTTRPLGVMGNSYDGTTSFCGSADEIRISNTARWTTNFTPPTIPYGQQYVTGPFYVATTSTTQINVSPYASVAAVTVTQSTPPGTTIKWAASFDNRATWKAWNGAAWVSIGGLTAANLDASGNDHTTLQTAMSGMDVGPDAGITTIDFAYSLKTTNPNFTPSVDGVLVAMDEYQQIAPVTGYSSKRKRSGGTQPHTITNLGPTAYLVVDHTT